MPVVQAEDGQNLNPNCVYLLPPRKLLKVFQGKVILQDSSTDRGLQLPIDVCFRSLAEDQKQRGIGVILSGTGSDGTLGVRAVKDAGGMVMVQSEASAEFDGMPRSAIGTGLADFVAAPEELPALLLKYVNHPLAALERGVISQGDAQPESSMRQLFALMRERTGVDFSLYKPTTIERRIERRMSVQQIDSLASYVRFLETSAHETDVLFNNLLICVTRFFRDRELWELLGEDVLPALLETMDPRNPIRVWTPGCSTGEEAYSLAMIFTEVMERMNRCSEIKIFATDVSKESLETASIGVYSESMVADLSPERLSRHFVRRTDGFQINHALRKGVVFARHDVIKDPPFTRMDLVCCRNLLIYFQPPVQAKVLKHFRQALRPEGLMILGSSETTGELADRFTMVNARQRVYRLKMGARGLELPFPQGEPRLLESLHVSPPRPNRFPEVRTSLDFITREIIREFAPASLVVDENRELLHLFGQAGDYLRHPDGTTTNNILRLTGHSIGPALGPALHKASRDNTEFIYDNVRLPHTGDGRIVRLKVRPILAPGQAGRLFLVFIEDVRQDKQAPPSQDFQTDQASGQRIQELEQELASARDNLQATVEELETSNEELQASNEELLASNEELQSTNEELQSVNEELHTVNTEHRGRIEELIELSNDLGNLFTVANMGAVLVDEHLLLRKMASAVFPLTGLTPADVGAPIELLTRRLGNSSILTMATRVRDTGVTEELEVVNAQGRTLLVRATPFLIETGQSSGLVLTLVDITKRCESEARVIASEAMFRSVLNTLPAHVAVLDGNGTITQVNEAWDRFARGNGAARSARCSVGANYFDTCRNATGPFANEAHQVLDGMEAVLAGRLPHFQLDYPCHSPEGQRWFQLHVSRIALPAPGLVVSHSLIREHEAPAPPSL